GKISSDGCLKKEQMVVSAIASTPQTVLSGCLCCWFTSFINAVVRRFSTLSIYVILSSCEFYKVRTIKCIMPIPITKWIS
ncbi:hypothetical protein, partial [Shigella sonnei]